VLVCALAVFAWSERGDARTPPPEGGGEDTGGAEQGPEPEPEPTWRFRDQDRPVKVVVLAGSVGAWPNMPYAKHFERMCAKVEVKNISKTGYGAYALKHHFREQVLENRYLNLADPEFEYWVVFQGGLNSIAMPEQTNRHIWGLTKLARGRGIGVVGLSPTPWGDDSDKRWKGADALRYWKNTRTVVDFIAGRSDPSQALGKYRSMRENPDAPWDPAELPDVGIDLYDTKMRDLDAEPNDYAKVRAAIARDSGWKRDHADLDQVTRDLVLHFDAFATSLMPRWYLREELRAFDHIHPNKDGHALIAELTCPQLPESWGCRCD
jgi:hypothetical protein